MNKKTDIIGSAMLDYYFHDKDIPIIVHSPEFDADQIAPSWYFRNYEDMPELEKIALKNCRGHILDIGAGTGQGTDYL